MKFGGCLREEIVFDEDGLRETALSIKETTLKIVFILTSPVLYNMINKPS